MKVLFDFLEEQLDLPALFIDVGDGFGTQPEMVGQKFVVDAAFRVAVADPPQPQALSLTCYLNDVVRGDAGFTVYRVPLQKFINGITLEAGHKENVFFSKGLKPGVAIERPVKDHNGAFGKFEGADDAAFVGFGPGYGDKSRNGI